ncbi:MAG: pentapeptide repeat-containing protein [Candidatus Bathyarchaeota archaeon]|nr:pentapeptide repeat-containing protein [Candidatus Termiticorpusculum sp.]
MLTTNEIGIKIAIARKLKNLSQAELAEQLSISTQAVGKWERGESMPDIIMFNRLAILLGVDMNYFVKIDPDIQDTEINNTTTLQQNKNLEKLGWNMSRSNWIDADFSGLHGLTEKFDHSNIEKCKFIESKMPGTTFKNNNIKNNDFTRSDLNHCKFTASSLSQNIFVDCNLSLSEFSKSNIINCDFNGANLTGTSFKWSQIKKINLTNAILNKIKFELGQLTEITFNGEITQCHFENCDFTQVIFNETILRNCFFKNAKLKQVKIINCKVDKITYAFMKACKADLSNITSLPEEKNT